MIYHTQICYYTEENSTANSPNGLVESVDKSCLMRDNATFQDTYTTEGLDGVHDAAHTGTGRLLALYLTQSLVIRLVGTALGVIHYTVISRCCSKDKWSIRTINDRVTARGTHIHAPTPARQGRGREAANGPCQIPVQVVGATACMPRINRASRSCQLPIL